MQQTASTKAADSKTDVLEALLLTGISLGAVSILSWILKFSAYGFDFTDESFYLAWIANPFIYKASTTQFGFLYHPLYWLLDGNIAYLRRANILITFFLAFSLFNIFFEKNITTEKSGRYKRWIVSLGLASTSFAFLGVHWLPTPSYNSLTLQALILVAIGFLLAGRETSRSSVFGWTVMGIGGWVLCMAKPTSAALLCIFIFAGLQLAHKLNVRLMLMSLGLALSLLLFSAIAIDNSLQQYINRLKSGADYLRLLGGGHSLEKVFRLDNFKLGSRDKVALVLFAAAAAAASLLLITTAHKHFKIAGAVICLVLVSLVLVLTTDVHHSDYNLGDFRGLIIWAIPLATCLTSYIHFKRANFSSTTRKNWVLILVLITLPYSFAFGTNNNYWQAASAAGVFWVLAGLVLLVPTYAEKKTWLLFIPIVLIAQSIIALLLSINISAPYRQDQALRLHSHPTTVGRPDSVLILSRAFSEYITSAIDQATKAGFKAQTPVIDMTGQSAGILYALQAQSIGQAWIIGGYPGSLKLATEALKSIECKTLASAWLLVEPNGPRSISGELLVNFGMDLKSHYEPVASWNAAVGAGGYTQKRVQILYKPVPHQVSELARCKA
jgi:hypothetical protein